MCLPRLHCRASPAAAGSCTSTTRYRPRRSSRPPCAAPRTAQPVTPVPIVVTSTNTPSACRRGLAMNDRVKVWDLPVRVFHWMLAVSFAGAYALSESERLRNVHVMLGYTVLGL